MTTQTTSFEKIFHPVEHAIFSDWLRRPECARNIELVNYHDDYDDDVPELYEDNVIRLRAPQFDGGNGAYIELDNAVARICPQAVQHRLPQWGMVNADGDVICARHDEPVHDRAIDPLPQRILEINWAASGQKFRWEQAHDMNPGVTTARAVPVAALIALVP